MKKLFFTGAILLMSIFSFAQKDPKAKAILDQVMAKFKSYSSLAANFSYQITNSVGKAMATKKGTLQMKGDKYIVDLGGNKIISDGATIWNYDPSAKEVTVNKVGATENSFTPQKLFTDFYSKDFKYVLDKDSKVGGKEVNKIVLQPFDRSKPVDRIYVAIDKVTKNIVSTTVVEKSGNRYVYALSNLKPNISIADANFAFDKAKYPGVEVVDLR